MFDRRELLRAGLALAAFSSAAAAAEPLAQQPSAADGPSQAQQALAQAIGGCLNAGNICMDHCLSLLGRGDTSMAECAKTVHDMLAVCSAVQALAAGKSAHLKAAVQLCLDVCTDCERACRKHEGHHTVCKACADACAASIKAARALLS